MNKLILAILISIALLGCEKEIDLKIEELNSIEVSLYSDHELFKKMDFQADSIELEKFKTWLRNNKKGWDTYLATQAVGNLLIKGEGFTLNIGQDWAVVNYQNTEGQYLQFIKSIASNEFKYFHEL